MKTILRNNALVLVALAAAACSVESRHSAEDLGEATEAVTNVCPTASIKGIDIASFQHPNGAAINWTKVATAEKFAIIKATEKDNYTNSYYPNDIQNARAAGLVVGSYHFLAPSSQTGVSGATQAQYFLAHASIKPGDLPPMLDVETSPSYGSVLRNGEELAELAYDVGLQLGRGHPKQLADGPKLRQELLPYVAREEPSLHAAAKALCEETLTAWKAFQK